MIFCGEGLGFSFCSYNGAVGASSDVWYDWLNLYEAKRVYSSSLVLLCTFLEVSTQMILFSSGNIVKDLHGERSGMGLEK